MATTHAFTCFYFFKGPRFLIFIEIKNNVSQSFDCEEILQETVEIAGIADVLKSSWPIDTDWRFTRRFNHLCDGCQTGKGLNRDVFTRTYQAVYHFEGIA